MINKYSIKIIVASSHYKAGFWIDDIKILTMSGQTTDDNGPIDMNSLWSNISGNIVAKNGYNVGIGNNGSSDTKLSVEIPTSNSSMSHGLK